MRKADRGEELYYVASPAACDLAPPRSEMRFRRRLGTSTRHRKTDGETNLAPPSRHWLLLVFFILIGLGAIARAIMPWGVRDYVNRTLDRSPLYSGKIGKVEIHLWRGAY